MSTAPKYDCSFIDVSKRVNEDLKKGLVTEVTEIMCFNLGKLTSNSFFWSKIFSD